MNSLISGLKSLFVSESEPKPEEENVRVIVSTDREATLASPRLGSPERSHLECNTESDSEPEQEVLEDNEESILRIVKGYALTLNFLESQTLLYTTQNKKVYIVKGSELINKTFIPYKFQRHLDIKHVENIASGIIESKMMYHPIILGYVLNTEVSVLDGQHRLNALKQVPIDILQDVEVQIDLIQFPEDSIEVSQMYKNINTRLEIDQDILNQEQEYISLLYMLKECFPKCITSKKTYVHHINENELLEALKKYKILSREKDLKNIVDNFQNLNQRMKKLTNELSLVDRKMCDSKDFYIGIEFPENIQTL